MNATVVSCALFLFLLLWDKNENIKHLSWEKVQRYDGHVRQVVGPAVRKILRVYFGRR